MTERTDAIVVGGGLAGLVAAAEMADAGKKVTVLEQEGENSLGGQAFWSLGGLFLVDSPEQRRMRIRDSVELAWQDWLGSAQFDRPEDHWPRQWARAYVDFAGGEMRSWLHGQGVRWFPVVGWAERGGSFADGHGNSVPRFHITWGTGPGVIEPFERRVREHMANGLITLKCRHQASRLIKQNGAIVGVAGETLQPSTVERGQRSSREITGEFEIAGSAVLVTSGGIGGNFDLVRKNWPSERLGGPPPRMMVAGVPHHVDGRMLDITRQAGGAIINSDRMWHYTEGVQNWDPIWPSHGIRILPGPSSMWFDATGKRLPAPCLPGFDTLTTLKHILSTGHEYSWFVLTQKIIEKEFALSGSEQNPDFTSRSWRQVLKRVGKGAPPPVEAFKKHGADFVVRDTLADLVEGMNQLTEKPLIDHEMLKAQIVARDLQIANPFSKDAQITAIHGARAHLGDKLIRTAKPHRILDPEAGPLIAVKLHVLTRKTLGGLHTNLNSQVLDESGEPVPGLYSAGEVAGFGGGGYHGYNALEGTFLGGCIFSGRIAGRHAASEV